jgi:hypothetical protein
MHTVEQFFAHLATRIGDDLTRVVDALEVGVVLDIPTKLLLCYVAELTERGWIEPLARSPYGTLHVHVTHKARQEAAP